MLKPVRFDTNTVDEPDSKAKEMLSHLLFWHHPDLYKTLKFTQARSTYDRIFKVDGLIKLGDPATICLFDLKTNADERYTGVSFTASRDNKEVLDSKALPDFYIFISRSNQNTAWCVVPSVLRDYINSNKGLLRNGESRLYQSLYIILYPRTLDMLSSMIITNEGIKSNPGRSVDDIVNWANENQNPMKTNPMYGGIEKIFESL